LHTVTQHYPILCVCEEATNALSSDALSYQNYAPMVVVE
jgi:hypothetical protein